MSPSFVLAVLVKGVLILGLALGLAVLFRRASAAVRHGVWVAAFVSLLALPVLEAFAPKWSVAAPRPVERLLRPQLDPPRVVAQRIDVRALGEIEREVEREVARLEVEVSQLARDHAQAHAHARALHVGDHTVVTVAETAPVVHAVPRGRLAGWVDAVSRDAILAVLWLWGLGALAVALVWGVAYAAAGHAVAKGVPVTDEDARATWERVLLLSEVSRPVRLLRSTALDIPIAWGWGEAAVVLPPGADDWDDDRLEAVLFHELAHIQRGDARSQLVAQIALVLHWANPLAWFAYRRFLLDREHACDDVVLEHGARPSAYAGHLVQVARDLRRRSAVLAAVAPMARRSNLEGRVLSILDPARKRSGLGRAASVALTALLLAVGLPLAALQLTASAQASEPVAFLEAPAHVAVPEPDARLLATLMPEPEEAPEPDEIVERLTGDAPYQAVALGVADVPTDLRLSLDTIPDFDEVIRPALERALEAIRAMRTSERHRQLGFTDDDWDEMEEDIRESIEEARVDYDEAMQEAIEDALEDLEDEDWSGAYTLSRDGQLRALGADQRRAIERAQRQLDRAHRDLDGVMRRQADRSRTLARQQATQARLQSARARQQAEEARRQATQAQGQAARARAQADRAQQQAAQGRAYAYTFTEDGVRVTRGDDAWEASLDNLELGLDGIETAIDELGDSPHPGAVGGLHGGLSGIQAGLSGITASAQTASAGTRRALKARAADMNRRIDALHARLNDCSD